VTTTPDTRTLDKGALARLTAAKAIANTALRWIPPFLPTLERAFGASTTQLTTVIGAGEIAGLSTAAVGPHLDRGRERTVMVSALCAISLSSVIALGGSLVTFAVAFVVLIMGVANFTVAGHAWISHRVDYRWRARSIGLFETSWALALLVGGPLIALLINQFGWRAPFVFLAVGGAGAAILVATTLPPRGPPNADPSASANSTENTSNQRLTRSAWLVVIGSASMATAGLSVFVISGSWLDRSFGVSTGGLGFILMGFGGIELVASTSTAAFADNIGKLRSTLGGLVMLGTGLIIMLAADDKLAIGILGLLVFLLGFEYGFVTSLSLISEAMPEARGSTLALGNAVATLARGSGVIASGWLFDKYGIGATATLSGSAAAVASACFLLSRRAN
jgi:predicted MFS family arabinose efflux permease